MARLGGVLAAVLLAVAAPIRDAHAQGPGGALSLDLSPTSFSFPSPGVSEFNGGWVYYSSVTVTVDAPGSIPWDLLVRSLDPDLGGYGKPVDDLQWQVDGTGTWQSLSTAEQTVYSGSGTQSVLIHFRLRLAYARDAPDTYGADLAFSVQ